MEKPILWEERVHWQTEIQKYVVFPQKKKA